MLSGIQYEQFSKALRDAVAYDARRLERLLRFRLDRNLQDIIVGGSLEEIVFEVIRVAESGGWTAQLLRAARESNPGNPSLLAFAQQFSIAPTNAPSRQHLELIIEETNSFLDVMRWRTKLGEIESRICRVEIVTNKGLIYGTAFLVAPDLLMTNYHVMDAVIAGEQGRANSVGRMATRNDVVFRFDYKRLADGSTINAGTLHRLAGRDWLIDYSPTSPVDNEPEPKTRLPRLDELDYAIVRLAKPAGTESVGGQEEPGSASRGWVTLPSEPHTFVTDSALFIVQHPKGRPLQLALEIKAIRNINANRTRVTYRTNTLKGSSGSPCFTQNWEPIALHHSGDPDYDSTHKPEYNEGIPFSSIMALLKERQLSGLLREEEP